MRKTNRIWSPLPPDQIKLNSDAALFNDGTFGLGFMIRNVEGKVILTGAKRSNGDGDSTLANALALRFGIQSALKAGVRVNFFETDSENLVKEIWEDRVDSVYVMVIVDEIRSMVNNVPGTAFKWCGRDANKVTHTLAHFGDCNSFEYLWVGEAHSICSPFLQKDVRREPTF